MSDENQSLCQNRQIHFLFIDGIKGIACVLIMISHYTGVVKYSNDCTYFQFITQISKSIFSAIIDENFWLQLFFVLSGFLLSYSIISSLKDLIKKIIKRFLRFYLPILAACLIIYLLAISIGFYNNQTTYIFNCSWFQSFYSNSITIIDLIKDPLKTIFVGVSKLNPPYWVIRNMFLTSIIIYFISYITGKVKNNRVLKILIYALTIVIAALILDSVFTGCLIGALCGIIVKEFRKNIEKIPQTINIIVCIMCVLMPLGLHNAVYNIFVKCFDIGDIVPEIINRLEFSDSLWGVLYFALFIIMVSCNTVIQKTLSCKLLCNLNKISFGIYSFHWPFMCSIGALLMIKLPVKQGIILGWIIGVSLTIVVSIFYHVIFENNIDRFLRKFR